MKKHIYNNYRIHNPIHDTISQNHSTNHYTPKTLDKVFVALILRPRNRYIIILYICSLLRPILVGLILYYVNNNSDVFAYALDMLKAFDRINLIKLFNKLFIRGFPAFILRFIFIPYSNSNLRVFWNGFSSNCFVPTNGVKQDGISSPFLFNVFIDAKLAKLNVGC